MDIRIMKGDATEFENGCLAHGVNCQGVMGSGIALTIKQKFPKVFDEYKSLCDEHRNFTSDLLGVAQPVSIGDGRVVVNCFTQDFYGRSPETYSGMATTKSINESLRHLSRHLLRPEFKPEDRRIHMPKIGGTRGGLDFEKEVMPVIEKIAADYPEITYIIWEYPSDGINA